MKKTVLALSGGLDSATLLALSLLQGEVHCISFLYGSKHSKYEFEAAKKLVKFYQNKYKDKVTHETIDLQKPFASLKSNLMQGQGEIPEGHYKEDSMKLTVVPGRNLIFASILAAIAESYEFNCIALGVHAGDHHIYPDCRPIFIDSLKRVVYTSSDSKVAVITPFLHLEKYKIVDLGMQLKVPYQFTRTCYKDQEIACGKCGSCTERIESFNKLNLKDPIVYE